MLETLRSSLVVLLRHSQDFIATLLSWTMSLCTKMLTQAKDVIKLKVNTLFSRLLKGLKQRNGS